MNDSVRAKEIINLQDNIKTDEPHYKSKRRKVFNFNKYYLPFAFLKDMHEGNLSLEDAGDEQSNFGAKSKNLNKGKETIGKYFFKIT